MERKNIIVSLLCIGCCLCAFVSCKCNSNSADGNDSSGEVIEELGKEEAVTLQLSTTEISNMSIGDSQYLIAKYTEIPEAMLEWTSSNADIVTVKKIDEETCEVIANRIGSAVITVEYATYTQTCQVTVAQNNLYPSLHLNTGVEDCVNVLKGEKLDLSCFVRYNGKVFADVALDYTVEVPTLGTIDKETQVFTAAEQIGEIDETDITITAAWRDIPSELLTKTITVKVVSETVVVVNGGELADMELMTVAEFEGKTYQNEQEIHSVEVYIDGVPFTDYTTAITDSVALDGTNNPVAVLDGTTIKANAYGTAKYTIFVGEHYSVSYDITVARPLEKYGKTIKDFSTLDGELPTEEIFKDAQGEKEIFFAYQDGYSLTVESGKVLGVQSSQTEMSVESIVVYNDKVGYTIDIECYAKLIKTADDFKEVFDTKATKDAPVTVAGYFEMKNDVLVDEGFQYLGTNRTFTGVFNGKGNKLTIPMRAYGLFGALEGTIQNAWIEFTDISDKGSWGANVLLAGYCRNCKELSNLYITIDESSFEKKEMYNAISLVDVMGNNVKMDSIVVDYGDILPSNYSYSMYGLLAQYFNDTKDLSKYRDVYFISSTLKHLAVKTSETAPGMYVMYAGNDTALKEAEKEACQTANIKQYNMSGISRYDSWADLAKAGIALSPFDEIYWDTSSGVPQWKGEYVVAMINGETRINGTLSNNANSTYKSATVSVTYNEEALPLTLHIVEGADLVSVDGATVTAKVNTLGTAIVEATFRLPGENIERVQYFTFDVSYEAFAGEMRWSSGDEKIYLPSGMFLENENLSTVIDLDTQEVLYANGVWDTAFLSNESCSVRSLRVGVTGDKGTLLQVQLYSYAYVITTETEMLSLFTAKETKSLTGYYALANDITVTQWASDGMNLTFAGVFDGNGYKLTVPMRAYGLFGRTVTGQIKNTWFEFTHVRNIQQYGRNTLLAYQVNSEFKVNNVTSNTLENLYITVDQNTCNKNPDGTAASTALSNFSLMYEGKFGTKMNNIVVDYTGLNIEINDSNSNGYGLLMQYATGGTWGNQDSAMSNYKNIYFISSKLKLIANYTYNKYRDSHTVTTLYATNDEANKATDLTAWQEADSADEKLGGATVTYKQNIAAGIYRYDDWTKFDCAANKNFSTFAPEYWTIENNTIRWKVK